MSIEALLLELQKEYVQELPLKIETIRKSMSGSDHAPVREDFHKLKGTGKTYGIPEISELAEVVEMICLKRPEYITQAVPDALALLEDIHSQRSRSQCFQLDSDQRFTRLKQRLLS